MIDLNILLVEDSPDDAFLAIRALSKIDVNSVHIVNNGQEALHYLFGNDCRIFFDLLKKPDLILLDQRMPLLDGLQFMEIAQNALKSNTVPVVVITSSHLTHEKERFLELGVKDYVAKPVSPEGMSRVIKTVYQ